jgi:hypothetical protein
VNKLAEFRASLVSLAAAVMHCEYCCGQALPDDQPQPGWVGRDYLPGSGVVVVLQNPAVAPQIYDTQREALLQEALRDFSADSNLKTYEYLMQSAFDDMTGARANDVKPWPKWTHPIGKLFDKVDRAAEELRAPRHCSNLAWMNVVKFRTEKNRAAPQRAVQHSIDMHLRRELKLLRPKAIVSVGSAARTALESMRLPGNPIRCHLKLQGTSNVQIKAVQTRLREGGADI